MIRQRILTLLLVSVIGSAMNAVAGSYVKNPVEYVNPYMGNISHLLVPTYPIVHLPNSMLRVYPQRGDYLSDKVHGLPLLQISHRGSFVFNLSPFQGEESELTRVFDFDYDNETVKPYRYEVDLCRQQLHVEFAPSHQSAIYHFDYKQTAKTPYLILNGGNGELEITKNVISGYQNIWNNLRVYVYMEMDVEPQMTGVFQSGQWNKNKQKAKGDDICVVAAWKDAPLSVNVRYGVSYISVDQAKKNLRREIGHFDLEKVADAGYRIWNEELGKIQVAGGTENDRHVFYTSLYRCLERPVNISEDGRYFSVYDNRVHEDGGHDYYTDDWIWDSYRAAHPLRLLIDPEKQVNIIRSYLRMAESSTDPWLPTFPEVTGDSRRMNCNHGVSVIADAWYKGIRDFDLEQAYTYARGAIEEKTLAPWSSARAGWLDKFYKEKGYIPALAAGEKETVPEVNSFEKRQSVAVTLGTSYDQWCLSRIAKALGREKEASYYSSCSYNYRNLFNPKTSFFHPKDKNGNFIEPFDYRFSGGLGAREYYGENNAWVYRWDVQHQVADLVKLMGGPENFIRNLDATFSEWLGKSKYEFYAQLPDHTGNVGQFSMGNEPSLHIPYLYNYAQAPWKTQHRIRALIHQWFRNDLMGVPGDEDGGGLSSFVVFSMMGFYPVTPGLPVYQIGSPFFSSVKLKLGNGKTVEIIARNCSVDNKYIQSAKLNGKLWSKPCFSHEDIEDGAKLEFVMGNQCNTEWGIETEVQKAEIYTTSEKVKWQQSYINVQKKESAEADIIISETKDQVIDGFGGTFSELGWDALSLLTEEQRNAVLRELFGPDGMRYTFCRIPLGANDFARDWYSYNECPGDFEMKNFSVERDKKGMIPYVKAALSFNPDLKLWASPWSPPVWMKRTRHYATAPGDHNDFTEKNQVEGDHFIQEPEYLAAYALYLSKFIDAYKENGINISLLQFQNEPYTKHQWPNCLWLPESMANFIGKYLGPAFSRKHPDVRLWFGTFNCNKMEDLDEVMQHPDASKYLYGIGLQWEGKDIVAEVHRKYPAMKLMQTENECGGGSIDWAAAEHTFDLLKAYLNGGVNSYMYFNMVLRDEGASSWGWRQNSLIRVDSRTREVLYTPEFYLMKHLSHFVKVGAYRLQVSRGDNVLAFQNPDGQVVVLCVNKDDKAQNLLLYCKGSTLNIQLAPKTFNTILI